MVLNIIVIMTASPQFFLILRVVRTRNFVERGRIAGTCYRAAPRAQLAGFTGTLQTDAYEVYDSLKPVIPELRRSSAIWNRAPT